MNTFSKIQASRPIIGPNIVYDYEGISNASVLNTITSTYDNTLMNGATITTTTSKKGTSCLNLVKNNLQFLQSNGTYRSSNRGFSCATWFKLQSQQTADLIELVHPTGDNAVYVFIGFGQLGLSTINKGVRSAFDNIRRNDSGLFNDDQWHHVAWNIDKNGVWTVFIDKIQRAVTVTSILPVVPRKLSIGRNTGSTSYFNGQIDNTIIKFDSIMTTEEIQSM